ncbi:gp29 [Bacillus phage G]|uniref:Gp29 n=1 Tax=Bacillus phage G TaxID=2884420 RepID=G3MB99_9CAUD|nr:gp29 [Bacillus phage G]AEO93300.1 gp29 [Bacillus phage G]
MGISIIMAIFVFFLLFLLFSALYAASNIKPNCPNCNKEFTVSKKEYDYHVEYRCSNCGYKY